jgi:DNA-binding CsgD family transcriptional regulator
LIRYWYKRIKKTEQAKKETDKINLEQAGEIESLKQQLLQQLAVIRSDNINYQALVALQQDADGNTGTAEEFAPDDSIEIPGPVLPDEQNGMNQKPDDIQFLKEYNLTQKEHWAAFKESFRKIYPEFENSIIAKMGAVSGAELRLMMLTKLGLSNKEIAQTLLISPDSVKKGKYRLYKKIGINSAAELNELL